MRATKNTRYKLRRPRGAGRAGQPASARRLQELGQGIEMTLQDEVFNNHAEAGFDPAYGARPLKRLIQRMIENPLAEAILSGAVDQTRPVVVAMSDQGLVFKHK